MASFVSNQIADRAYTVTKSDTDPNVYSYLYVGTGGTLTVVTEGGDTVQFTNVANGSYLWIRTSLVKSTGSTASGILGFV